MEHPLVFEYIYNAPVSNLWLAITDKDEMRKWYFDLPEFKPQVGFEFQFWGGTESCKYLHHCKITEVDNEKRITYSWRYDGYNGISYVTFELFPEGNQTRLILTHSGIESFPEAIADFKSQNFVEGWTAILGTSLKENLEKD